MHMNSKRSSTSRSPNTRNSTAGSKQKAEQKIAQRTIKAPTGYLHLAAADGGLAKLEFAKKAAGKKTGSPRAEKILNDTEKALRSYFKGKTGALKGIPLAFDGTDFQVDVWKALIKIPAGQTMSYGEIAKSIRRPNAFRAVGSACGRNHLCLIVPCHRVVASNNKLGGFSGGLEIKRQLLKHEGSLSS